MDDIKIYHISYHLMTVILEYIDRLPQLAISVEILLYMNITHFLLCWYYA